MFFSLACLIAKIFPSVPLTPKPGGTKTPSYFSKTSSFDGFSSKISVSIQSMFTFAWRVAPACYKASLILM